MEPVVRPLAAAERARAEVGMAAAAARGEATMATARGEAAMAAAVAAAVAESECAECACVLEEGASSGHQGHNRSSRCPKDNP